MPPQRYSLPAAMSTTGSTGPLSTSPTMCRVTSRPWRSRAPRRGCGCGGSSLGRLRAWIAQVPSAALRFPVYGQFLDRDAPMTDGAIMVEAEAQDARQQELLLCD